jgi:hypothetical protein
MMIQSYVMTDVEKPGEFFGINNSAQQNQMVTGGSDERGFIEEIWSIAKAIFPYVA